MFRRVVSSCVSLTCCLSWLAPAPALAGASVRQSSTLAFVGAQAPPPPPAQPQRPAAQASSQSAPKAMPSSPCSAWAADPAVTDPAPAVCLNYISAQGNAELKLAEPVVSKVPQDAQVVAEFAGVRGDTATKSFTTQGPWRLSWESDSDFMLTELRQGPRGRETAVSLPKITVPGKKTKRFAYGGTHYLHIRADGSWRATVTLEETTFKYDYDIAASTFLVNPVAFPILVTYAFGEGRRQEITLNPGQRLPVQGTVALTDYDDPKTPPELRNDFPGLTIVSVQNASKAAAARRRQAIQKERQKKLDPRGTQRAARSELQHTAIGVERHNSAERERDQRWLANKIQEDDRRWKASWNTAGIATLVAGIGVGTTLIILGGTKLGPAKDEFNAAEAILIGQGTMPSPALQVEVGRLGEEVSSARKTMTTGIIVASASAVVGTALLVIGTRTPSKRRAEDHQGLSWKLVPSVGLRSAGLVSTLRF